VDIEGIICTLNIHYSHQEEEHLGVQFNRLNCIWKLFSQSFLFWDQIFLILPTHTQILYVVISEGFLSLASENKHSVIRTSLRDFRPLWYSSRDGHAEGEHVNRGRDNPGFCPTLQVLDMSTLGDAADVNPVIKFLPHTVNHVAYGYVHTCPLCHVIYHSCDEGS
jgi:hypothetical protein